MATYSDVEQNRAAQEFDKRNAEVEAANMSAGAQAQQAQGDAFAKYAMANQAMMPPTNPVLDGVKAEADLVNKQKAQAVTDAYMFDQMRNGYGSSALANGSRIGNIEAANRDAMFADQINKQVGQEEYMDEQYGSTGANSLYGEQDMLNARAAESAGIADAQVGSPDFRSIPMSAADMYRGAVDNSGGVVQREDTRLANDQRVQAARDYEDQYYRDAAR